MCKNPGNCFDQLSEIIDSACELAEKAYAEAVKGKMNLPPIKVRVKPRFGVNGDAVDFWGRTTAIKEEGPSPHLLVTLSLSLHELEDHQFLQLPALVFHEVFVHVFQGIMDFQGRENCGAMCAFTEGAMDCVGSRKLEAALKIEDWGAPLPNAQDAVRKTYVDCCADWHKSRRRTGPASDRSKLKRPHLAASKWKMGADALEKLEEIYVKNNRSQEELWNTLMLLNTSLIKKKDRQAVSRVLLYVLKTPQNVKKNIFYQGLTSYFDVPDLDLFLNIIESIKPNALPG